MCCNCVSGSIRLECNFFKAVLRRINNTALLNLSSDRCILVRFFFGIEFPDAIDVITLVLMSKDEFRTGHSKLWPSLVQCSVLKRQ
jgi:hypothetical protein